MIFKQLSRRQFSFLAGKFTAGPAAFFSFSGCSAPSPGSGVFSKLQEKLTGNVITGDDENYAARTDRLTWQLRKTDRRPDAIVQPEPVDGVTKAVKLYDTAYSMRRRTFLAPYSFWMDEQDDEQNIAWLQRTQEILAPLSTGHFISEADPEASPERAQRSFSKASWEKIHAVKDKYDPGGVFHTYLGHG